MRVAPWRDFNGKEISEGDTIRHPSGEHGVVVFCIDQVRTEDQWRVDYGDGSVSRLVLQVGFKGQAEVAR